MGKPITFEVLNRLNSEAVHTLTLLDVLFRGCMDAEQITIEDLALIGMALCQNGQTQLDKVWRDWKNGDTIPPQDDSESTVDKQIKEMLAEPDYKPVEASPVVRFMENVDFRDIMDWKIFLERNGHDVARRCFSDILDDAYRPEEAPQAQR